MGIPIFPFPNSKRCPCGNTVDKFGDHLLGCNQGQSVATKRHDALCKVVYNALLTDNSRCRREARCSSSKETRPGDVYHPDFERGLPACNSLGLFWGKASWGACVVEKTKLVLAYSVELDSVECQYTSLDTTYWRRGKERNMTSTIGKVGSFDGTQDEWEHYVERLGFYFTANKVTDKGQRKAVLLSVYGAQTYKLICNLLAPQTSDAVEYDDIVKRVQDHVRPKPSVILQRFRFNSLNRKEVESVADFVTELRRLSTDCAFGDALSDMLRDRLLCGINEEKIQRRLLQEDNLTFENALRIARAMETAAKNSLEMQQGGTSYINSNSSTSGSTSDIK